MEALMTTLGLREPTRRRAYAARLALLAVVTAVAGGCDAVSGPGGGAKVYVLTSIGGTPVHPSLNIWTITGPDYAAAGAELMMLGDTIILYPGGRGEERNRIQSRSAGYANSSPDSLPTITSHQHDFSYVEVGRLILTVSGTSGDRSYATYRRGRGDVLEVGTEEPVWRFERAFGRGAP